jgi:hypothetical protein
MTSTIRSTGANGKERLDRCLATVERHVEDQEASIVQRALSGLNTAGEEFDLQKTHLLLAILRESRERVVENSGRAQVNRLHLRVDGDRSATLSARPMCWRRYAATEEAALEV